MKHEVVMTQPFFLINSKWNLFTIYNHFFLLKTGNKAMFSFENVIGSKRQRISVETDHDTGSESSPSSPRLKNTSFSLPTVLSPSQAGAPSSPESDLDVDSAPDEATPENLSLKKDDSTSPPSTPSDNLNILRHVGNNNGHGGFLPYHQAQFMGSLPSQRSPIDVLLR